MNSHKNDAIEVADPAAALRRAQALGRKVLAVPKSAINDAGHKKQKKKPR
jgi:hypothetical protein